MRKITSQKISIAILLCALLCAFASESFAQASKTNQIQVEALMRSGSQAVLNNNSDKAIADFSKAIELNPHYADAYYSRGLQYSAFKQELDKAIADFSKAIQINPQYANFYDSRGNVYYRKKDYDKAIADLSKVIQLYSQDKLRRRRAAGY